MDYRLPTGFCKRLFDEAGNAEHDIGIVERDDLARGNESAELPSTTGVEWAQGDGTNYPLVSTRSDEKRKRG